MIHLLRESRRALRILPSERGREFLKRMIRLVKEQGLSGLGDVWTFLRAEGMTAADECMLLYDLGREIKVGVIVEVGSYRGRSTLALGMGSIRGSKVPVYAVEPHEEFLGVLGGRFGPDDRGAFFDNVRRSPAARVIHLVNLPSEIAAQGWDRPVALLWLDGDHTWEGVRSDYDAWSPFLTEDALVVLHDSTKPGLGPHRLAERLLETGQFRLRSKLGLLTILQRSKALG